MRHFSRVGWHPRVRRLGFGPNRELGSALVELAVILPILMLLFVGTIDFGRIFYRSMAVAQAARAGAEYGAYNMAQSTDVAGMRTAGKTAVASDLTLVDGDFAPAPSRTCECANQSGSTFTAPSPSTSCDASDCAAGTHSVVTVNVTVVKSYTTLMNYPRIPRTVTITRTTKLRVK